MAKILGGIGKFLLGGGLVGMGIRALSKPKAQTDIGPATRDDAAESDQISRELEKRKGAAADMITGTQGAEALASGGRIVRGN